MPNWVYNKLTFTADGNVDELKKFADSLKSDEDEDCKFDFNKLIPIPEELPMEPLSLERNTNQELVEKYRYDNWYDWCIHNWGVKWNARPVFCDGNMRQDFGNKIVFRFATPWAVPKRIVLKTFEKSPCHIVWEYAEECMGAAGRITYDPKAKPFDKVKVEEVKNSMQYYCSVTGADAYL